MAQSISPSQIKTLATCGDSTHALAVKLNVSPPTFYCQTISAGGGGTVTNVASGSGLTGGPITTTGTLSCLTASASVFGCLSSADWTTFNAKGSGTVTSSGSPVSGNIPKFTTATNIAPAAASDVVALFSTCSGTQYLGADGACHTPGAGTVTTVGNVTLTALFTCTVSNPTTTPTWSCSAATAAAHTFWGNNTGSTATASFQRLACADLSDSGTGCSGSTSSGGTVTSIATTAPIGGGTITTTGTITCTTCTTNAASLTANLPVIGAGSNAVAVGTRSGSTTEFGTVTGSLTSGNCLKADGSGNIVDAGGPCGAGGGGIINPRSEVYIYDEFAGISAGTGSGLIASQYLWLTEGTDTITVPAASSGSYGLINIAAGSSNGNDALLAFFNPSTGQFAYNASTFDTLFRFSISRTTNIQMAMGLIKPGDFANNRLTIGYNTGSADTNFMLECIKAGTATRTSLGLAADTSMHTGRIRSTAAGTVLISIDGGTEQSCTTNVPTVLLSLEFATINLIASSTNFTIDYVWHHITSGVSR